MKYKVVNLKTNEEVSKGDSLVNFRGEKATFVSFTPPNSFGSTGRIYATHQSVTHPQPYYPSVFDCTIVEDKG